jgi:hypothetical protein
MDMPVEVDLHMSFLKCLELYLFPLATGAVIRP